MTKEEGQLAALQKTSSPKCGSKMNMLSELSEARWLKLELAS